MWNYIFPRHVTIRTLEHVLLYDMFFHWLFSLLALRVLLFHFLQVICPNGTFSVGPTVTKLFKMSISTLIHLAILIYRICFICYPLHLSSTSLSNSFCLCSDFFHQKESFKKAGILLFLLCCISTCQNKAQYILCFQ